MKDFAKAQPWTALDVAAVSGLVIGRLTAKREVVYVSRVKPSGVK